MLFAADIYIHSSDLVTPAFVLAPEHRGTALAQTELRISLHVQGHSKLAG